MAVRPPEYFSRQVEAARRFYFVQRPGRRLQLESGGREDCSPYYNVDRKNFPHYLVEFVARGQAHIRLGNERWTLEPGSIFAYDGHLPHRLAAASADGVTKYFVAVRGPGVRALLARHGLGLGHVVRVGDFGRITEIFDDLVEVGCSERRGREEEALAIFRHLLIKAERLAVSREHLAGGAYSAYRRCREYMAEHFLRLKTAGDAAAACQLDQAYLCRLFQRFGGETPYAFLLSRRMEHAANLLRSTELPAKALALELGFSDTASFSRSFKRVFGIPPSRCRTQPADPRS